MQYQLYTVYRHNGHIASLNCQLQLQYRKVANTLQGSQQNHDTYENQNGINGTDNGSKKDAGENTANTRSIDVEPSSTSGVSDWQPFTFKFDAKQPQVLPQTNGLFVIHDASLQSKVLVFTMDVPEGFYEMCIKRLTPVFVSPAVGEVTWLQLLSSHHASDMTSPITKNAGGVTELALHIKANESLHGKLGVISVVAEHKLQMDHDAYHADPIFIQSLNPAAQCLALALGMLHGKQRL